MKVKYLIILLIVAATVCSCDRDKLFEREQYKKVFALLRSNNFSTNMFNIFAEVHELDSTASQGYLSAVVGGTHPTEKDIKIAIVEDEELFSTYNITNYGEENTQGLYARRLPRDMYDVPSYHITIRAGERYGLMDIKVRPNGLSPDSVYFIPFRVDRYSSYELNIDRDAILYRVFIKNFYATNRSATYYNLRYKKDGVNGMGTKQVVPVRNNSVRIMAGDLPYAAQSDTLNHGAMVLAVAEDNHVKISAWNDLILFQYDDDPDYPNIFFIYDDGFKKYKTFLLRYDYIYEGVLYEMKEELRLEYREGINY
jgi:hypothetical protein